MKFFVSALIIATILAGLYLSLNTTLHYRYPIPVESADSLASSSVLFLGDMMFDREIRKISEDKGYLYLFSCARDLLLAQSAVVGNLEGPITDNKSVSKGTRPGSTDNFQFTFDPQITDALLLSNIGYVNIGNNHIFNFGRDGLVETKKYLTKAGIQYFGDPMASSSIAYVPLSDRDLALINYNEFSSGSEEVLSYLVTKLIENEKNEGNLVIVYAHWGDEYATSSNVVEQNLAHAFIESGADAVIGSHPHVIQETEMYLGRPIFYSLGNFIFDQWWTSAVRTGLGVRVSFFPESRTPKFDVIMFTLNKDGTTCPVVEEEVV